MGKPLGATFLGIAILVLLAGGRRYFESQVWYFLSLDGEWRRGLEVLNIFWELPKLMRSGVLVLDHPGQIPRQSRQRLSHHSRGPDIDHRQLGHCLRRRSERV